MKEMVLPGRASHYYKIAIALSALVILLLINITSHAISSVDALDVLNPIFNQEEIDAIFMRRKGSGEDIDLGGLDRSPSLDPSVDLLRVGRHGAISSDLELCGNLTVSSVLQKFPEANAADAAVTQALCIGMINFFNSGVGGGGYAVFSGKNEQDHLFLDFREKAPQGAHKNMFDLCEDCSKFGGLAVAVPGELAGLYELYKARGSGAVSWHDLLEPVAKLAIDGWEVDEVLAYALEVYEPFFLKEANDWRFVLNSTGDGVKKAGDRIVRRNFSKMLMEVANNGTVKPFYDSNSWIAQSMAKSVQSKGGIMTVEDLESYNVNTSKPLSVKMRPGFVHAPYNDLTVLTSSGSSSGAALLSALSIMEQLPDVYGGDYQTKPTYELVEVMKWMASARSRLGDYNTEKLPSRIQEILQKNWTDRAVNSIKENSSDGNFKTLKNWTFYHPEYDINEPHGTAHFSIVDHHGNAVSLTTTINLLFGSLVHDPVTGIIFNNEMDDFSQPKRSNAFGLAASVYNFPKTGKRPLSSTAPTIILNELGFPDLIIGASGGSRITTSVLQTIIRIYWYKMPILEAISYPRIHHQLLPDELNVESASLVGKETVEQLKEMGHTVVEESSKSVVNAIRYFRGDWHAVSDFWRKRGISVVY